LEREEWVKNIMWWNGFMILLWAVSGAGSFIFWWIKEEDLTTREIPLIIICSIIGPFANIGGFMIHGKRRTIIGRKNSNKQ